MTNEEKAKKYDEIIEKVRAVAQRLLEIDGVVPEELKKELEKD